MKKLTRFGRNLFLWFLLVSLLPLAAVSATTYLYVRIQTKDRVLKELEYDASKCCDHVNTLLNAWSWRVTDFSSDGLIRDTAQGIISGKANGTDKTNELNAHLRLNKARLHPDILEVFVLDKGGTVIASSVDAEVGQDLSKADYFKRPLVHFGATEGMFLGDTESSNPTGQFQLVFSHVLKDRGYQSPIGVIALRVKIETLKGITAGNIETLTDGGQPSRLLSKAYITNKNGWLLANSSGVSVQRISTNNVRQVLGTRNKFIGEYENYMGVRMLGVTYLIGDIGWTITAERETKEIFMPIRRLAYIFGGIAGLSSLLIFGLAVAISTGVNKSIRELVRGTETVAKGDMDFRIKLNRRDELGVLSDSFNAMVDSLKTSVTERERLFSAVERAELEWERTFDAVKDAILSCDVHHNVVQANNGAARILNLRLEDLIGKTCHDLFPYLNEFEQLVIESARGLKPISKEIHDHLRDKTFLVSIYPMIDKGGAFDGAVHIIHDITALKQAEKELEARRVVALTKLAELAEKRHPETGHHLYRIKDYCILLAEELRLLPKYGNVIDDLFIKALLEAAMLHDIGKVAIPDSVLLKPGCLSPEEFELVKIHTIVGEDVLSYPEYFSVAREVCRSHHERWDGKGYPDGLKGEEIPLHARIIALSDTYDTLISERPYRRAMTHEEVHAIILGESGKHFDPDVVEAFIKREKDFQALAGTGLGGSSLNPPHG